MTAEVGFKMDSEGVMSASSGGFHSKSSKRMFVAVIVNFVVIYNFNIHNTLVET